MNFRIANRLHLTCPNCGYNIKFHSRFGIYFDIAVELFIWLTGFFIGCLYTINMR